MSETEKYNAQHNELSKRTMVKGLGSPVLDFIEPGKTIMDAMESKLPASCVPESACDLGYNDDCEMLDICESTGATYGVCYKGSLGNRCAPEAKHMIRMLVNQESRQKEQDLQQTKRYKTNLRLEIIVAVLSGIAAIGVIVQIILQMIK